MGYVEGFVLAVPAANKDAYVRHAASFEPLFKEFGVTRMVETWGDDVPDGKLTDFKGAVKAKDDEVVVFSWFEYPDKATRDAANEKIMSDPRMQDAMETMPFDGMRMIYAGFEPILDTRGDGAMGYADGFLVPVKTADKEIYLEFAAKAAEAFRDHGANRVVEAWGDDVPNGKVTDYRGAVKAEDGEAVVYSWVEWPSKEARDIGLKKVMEDPRIAHDHDATPFDGRRMVYGGFRPILDA
ncbi:DUF1428 domain-containing protein [Methylopila sp. M107]|uniref:DUF1428 domain-containing protein n=1 Tax=Methylopila sp. M107 TaxID=1101190 RepID=UPI00035F7C34|nr:DUF1428 domain-containing protein [Methylopila sp. M107]